MEKSSKQDQFFSEAGRSIWISRAKRGRKTTTVKLLTGMLAPSEGECRILGLNPAEVPEKVHAVSGVVTEHAQMYNNMTGKHNLIFMVLCSEWQKQRQIKERISC